MFTGIIQEVGYVKSIRISEHSKMVIRAKKVLKDLKLGESIAVNGVCLTVTEISSNTFTVEIMPETLKKTNIGLLKVGSYVNLEKALRLQDRLNGHIVQGHVDTVGKIIDKKREKNAIIIKIECDIEFLKYIVPKGSIAVDGVSLTVVDVVMNQEWFSVSIVPYTFQQTIIRYYSVGTLVNIECDILAKYIEKLLFYEKERKAASSGLSMEFLEKHGFVR